MDTAAERHHIDTVTDAALAWHLLDDLAPLYEEVFAEPPYCEGPREVGAFIDRYHAEHRQKGFRLALARDGEDIAGFAYGLPLASTTTWWDGLLDADIREDFAREDGRRTFAVMELAVLRSMRRRGIARALHTALLKGNPAERATLAVRPEAHAATALYAGLGYRLVGRSRPSGGTLEYLCMLRWLSED